MAIIILIAVVFAHQQTSIICSRHARFRNVDVLDFQSTNMFIFEMYTEIDALLQIHITELKCSSKPFWPWHFPHLFAIFSCTTGMLRFYGRKRSVHHISVARLLHLSAQFSSIYCNRLSPCRTFSVSNLLSKYDGRKCKKVQQNVHRKNNQNKTYKSQLDYCMQLRWERTISFSYIPKRPVHIHHI